MQHANYTTQYKDVLPNERELADITPAPKKAKVDDVYHYPNPFNHDPQSRRLRVVNSGPRASVPRERVVNRAPTIQESVEQVMLTNEQKAELTDRLLRTGKVLDWERLELMNGKAA